MRKSILPIILISSFVILLLATAICLGVANSAYHRDVEGTLVERAAALTAVADATRESVTEMHADGAFAQEELLAELRDVLPAGRS